MDAKLPDIAIAEQLAERIVAVDAAKLPEAARSKYEETLIDVAGLCLAARNEGYVKAAIDGWDEDGPCTAIGHKRALSAAGAAFVNGTAAHGEDFDDTFEGGPVHAGAVIIPAVLATAERHGVSGKAALEGIAVGVEIMCRMGLVAPKMVHKAGFHPTAVFGAMGAAAAVGKALSERVNAATLDDHRGWIERMHTMAQTTIAGGILVLLLMLAATVLSVVFATRGAMATNRPIVEVLHFIGAKSGFIAKQFQRHFLVLGLEGGVIGGGLAMLLFGIAGLMANLSIGTASGDQVAALFGSFSLSLSGYIAILAQIVLVAVVTAAASRRTVNRTLDFVD